jgi:hypothetical protein
VNDHGAHPRDSRGTPPTVIVYADPDFITSNPSLVGEPPLEIVVALHIGTAIYGNIGAANRLDFTVIGPAVNLVSRIEAMAKTLADRRQRRFRAGLWPTVASARPS